jgi:hypothetical protein
MRPLHIYLVVYFLLVLGAGLALWQAGVLGRVSPFPVVVAAAVAIGLGVFLAITSTPTRRRT